MAATRRMASPAAARSGGNVRGDHIAGLPAGVDLVHGREDEVAARQTEAWRSGERVGEPGRVGDLRASIPPRIHSTRSSG